MVNSSCEPYKNRIREQRERDSYLEDKNVTLESKTLRIAEEMDRLETHTTVSFYCEEENSI